MQGLWLGHPVPVCVSTCAVQYPTVYPLYLIYRRRIRHRSSRDDKLDRQELMRSAWNALSRYFLRKSSIGVTLGEVSGPPSMNQCCLAMSECFSYHLDRTTLVELTASKSHHAAYVIQTIAYGCCPAGLLAVAELGVIVMRSLCPPFHP